MGRGTQRTARHHGTRQHTGARHYGGRQYKSARHHRRAATYECAAALRERGSTCARHHICAATQLRGSIHERGTIANIDVNEAAMNETIRVAAIHKKIIYVCKGWHGRYTIPCSLPSPRTFANSSPSSQPALLDHHPVSPFLHPRSLPTSCSPTEPYPSLHHVFGMTFHLNSAPFLYLHHRHRQSQHIHLLYPSPPGPSTQN